MCLRNRDRGQDHVALGQIIGEGIQQMRHAGLNGGKLARLALILSDQLARAVEQRAGILPLVDHQRRAAHRGKAGRPLAGERRKTQPEDLRGKAHPAAPFSMMQLP